MGRTTAALRLPAAVATQVNDAYINYLGRKVLLLSDVLTSFSSQYTRLSDGRTKRLRLCLHMHRAVKMEYSSIFILHIRRRGQKVAVSIGTEHTA